MVDRGILQEEFGRLEITTNICSKYSFNILEIVKNVIRALPSSKSSRKMGVDWLSGLGSM